MKSYFKRTSHVVGVFVAAFLLSTIITACNGSADAATTGVTMAQVNSAIADAVAPLKTQIADQAKQIKALQGASGSSAHQLVIAPNDNHYATRTTQSFLHTESYGDSHNATRTQATDVTCTGIGTLTGRPDNSSPIGSSLYSLTSCTGYYATVTGSLKGEQSYVQTLPPNVVLLFDSANCTGTMYISHRFQSPEGKLPGVDVFTHGMVFRYGAGAPTDSTTYYMLPAHETPTTANILSIYNPTSSGSPGKCGNLTFANMTVRAIQPNDPAVSGIASAPIVGPVTLN